MSDVNKVGTDFAELLKSLGEAVDGTDNLVKALPQEDDGDDAAVAAAAADGAGENPEDEDDEDDAGEGEGMMAKSAGADEGFVDATDLLKSLMDRQDTTEGTLAKALTSLTTTISKQNDLIKSLQDQVVTLRNEGRGRKSVSAVSDKRAGGDTLAKSMNAEGTITPADLLAKSDVAFKAGKISGAEFNTVDVCLRNGWSIDPGVLTKIASA